MSDLFFEAKLDITSSGILFGPVVFHVGSFYFLPHDLLSWVFPHSLSVWDGICEMVFYEERRKNDKHLMKCCVIKILWNFWKNLWGLDIIVLAHSLVWGDFWPFTICLLYAKNNFGLSMSLLPLLLLLLLLQLNSPFPPTYT